MTSAAMGWVWTVLDQMANTWTRITRGYAGFLNKYPLIVLLIIGIASTVMTVTGIIFGTPPDMENPKVGFETRGTELSSKFLTWRYFDERQSWYPNEQYTYFVKMKDSEKNAIARRRRSHSRSKRQDFFQSLFTSALKIGPCIQLSQPFEEAKWFSHIVFEAPSADDLFSLSTIQELCQFQTLVNETFGPLRSAIDYPQFWSLPNYLTCLSGEMSCDNLTQVELTARVADIKTCAIHKKAIMKCSSPSKYKLSLDDPLCRTIPDSCTSKYYYDLFSFALSKNMFVNGQSTSPVYTTMVLPILQLQSFQHEGTHDEIDIRQFTPVYDDITKLMHKLKHSRVVGMNLGMKTEALGVAILYDTIFVGLAMVLATTICLMYSGSLFYALIITLSLIFSVGVSYFTYCIVFRIDFFPFINLLVVVLLVGIGADNTFILKHIFDNAEMESPQDESSETSKRSIKACNINQALSHAARSMLITNATTAAAFYANYVSDVVVMKCFAIFAGTTMLINYLLIISFLPAGLIVLERYIEPWCKCNLCGGKICTKIRNFCSAAFETFSDKLLHLLLAKLHFVWIVSFAIAFVGAAVVVFHRPGISLPKRNPLQMFRKSHVFEWYDDNMEDLFEFSSFLNETSIEIELIWGLTPQDVGKTLNPNDVDASIEFKKNPQFQLSLKTLRGLETFSNKLANSSLFSKDQTIPSFAQQFFEWSQHEACSKPNGLCCMQNGSKFNESLLNICLVKASKDLNTASGGPMFRGSNLGIIDGYYMNFSTIFNWSLIYEDLDAFYKATDAEVKRLLDDTNVEELRSGWWTSSWYYLMLWYDLQHSLLHGTPSSIAISVVVALVVAILTTRTILLSILSIVSICGTILITIACLVLLDWHLNIVESTIIILTAGLSFDFTLLYAASYKITDSVFRSNKVTETINFIGLPIFLSAIVTILTGMCMLPASTWAYYQIGLFMVLVTIISYLTSTLFFLSLLYLIGPQKDSKCDYTRLPCFETENVL